MLAHTELKLNVNRSQKRIILSKANVRTFLTVTKRNFVTEVR